MQIEIIYVIEYEGKTIGAYLDYEPMQSFVLGCMQNGFIKKSIKVYKYRVNSCYYDSIETIDLNSSKCPTVTNSTKVIQNNDKVQLDKDNEQKMDQLNKSQEEIIKLTNSEKYIDMAKQKIELQHKINMLKIHKKKIDESKMAYENDIKLFDLFSQNKQKDSKFVIPELFIKKYNLMSKLKEENNLSWETFVKEYQDENQNNYNELFGPNSYEEMFLQSDSESEEEKSDKIDEELDIESDSDTDTSVDESK
jgi:hypothetical protein